MIRVPRTLMSVLSLPAPPWPPVELAELAVPVVSPMLSSIAVPQIPGKGSQSQLVEAVYAGLSPGLPVLYRLREWFLHMEDEF